MTGSDTSSSQAWTVRRLLQWTTDYFKRNGVDDPRLSAEILLAHALQCPRIALYTRIDEQPTPDQLGVYREHVKQAAAQMPIAYLVGSREFFSLSFEVSPAVLIPRPETELLCQQVIDAYSTRISESVRLFDLGTGSGCIAVTLAKYLPQARIVAGDVAPEALAVAGRNARRHGVDERIQFVPADGLGLPEAARAGGLFDAVVSNPPYVAAAEVPTLARCIREYEPAGAITDGADGLSFYRLLAEGAESLLKPQGDVFVEIPDGQGPAVQAIFAAASGWSHRGTWKDSVNAHDRVMRFQRTA